MPELDSATQAGKTMVYQAAPEATDTRFALKVVDRAGLPIPQGAVNQLKLTVWEKAGGVIINNLDQTDIHGTPREILADGLIGVDLGMADMVIVDNTLATEAHVALLAVRYNGGANGFTHEIHFPVRNSRYPGP